MSNKLFSGRVKRPFSTQKKYLVPVTLLGFLSACTGAPPATPTCRVAETHKDEASGNAGCFVRVGDKLLTIGHVRTGRLDTPGGTADEGETAQCTAHRETFEETGFNVEVGQLLGVADNGFRFYECHLAQDVGPDIERFPVPEWSGVEVGYIKLTDPFDTLASEWRYPKRHLENLDMFNKTKEQPDS